MPISYSVFHDQALTASASGVLANDTDVFGNPLSIAAVNGNASNVGETITLDSGAALTLNTDGSFSYVPVAASVYTDSFQYTATDGTYSASTTVTINVTQSTPTVSNINAVNLTYGTPLDNSQLSGTASVAGTFTYTTDAGTILGAGTGQSEDVTFTPTDSTDYANAAATVNVNVAQATPTVNGVNDVTLVVGTPLDNGQLNGTASVAGTFTYTTDAGNVLALGNGQTEDVTFTPTDCTDYTSVPTSVTVNVVTPPVTAFTFSVWLDPGDTLVSVDYQFTSSALGGTVYASGTADPTLSNHTISTTGYDMYTATVSGLNISLPYGTNWLDLQNAVTTERNPAYWGINQGPSLAVDSEMGNVGSESFAIDGASGVLYDNGPDPGNIVSFTINEDYKVADSFVLHAADTAPVATGFTYSVLHDQTLTGIDLTSNGSDADGDPLETVIVSQPSNGHLTPVYDDGSNTYLHRTYTYKPNADWMGTDTFTIEEYDGIEDSAPATITIHVTDQAPVAQDVSFTTLHDQTLTTYGFDGLLTGPSDPDGDALTVTAINGTPIVSGQTFALPSGAELTVNSDGSFIYVPLAGQAYNDGFSYTVSDGVLTATASVSISVTDTAPVAQDETYYLQAGLTLSLDSNSGLLQDAYDADGDALTVQLVGAAPSNGTLNLQPDGSLTYVADTGFVGTDTFTYELSDGCEFSNTAQVTIIVQDQAPVASPNTFDVWTAVGVTDGSDNVLTGATDAANNPMTAVLVTGPQFASSFQLNPDGTFVYIPMTNPPAGFNGTDSFVIKANDGTLNSAPVQVALNLTSTPLANDSSCVLDAGGQIGFSGGAPNVLANAFNPMGAQLTAVLDQGIDPSVGTLNLSPNGDYTFAAGPNFQGEADFTFDILQDGNQIANCAQATVRIALNAFASASVSLTSVSFDGNATIESDDGEVIYSGPQWTTDYEYPISFTRSTQVWITPTFQVNPVMVPYWASLGNNILVRAQSQLLDEQWYLNFGQNVNNPIHLQLNGQNQLTTKGFVPTDNTLPNYTDYYSSLELTWQISPDNGNTWSTPADSNTSSNETFVTLRNPNGWSPWFGLGPQTELPQIRLSVLYGGVQGGLGATDTSSLVSDVFAGFASLRMALDDGTPITYYGTWLTDNATTTALIENHDGNCTGWSRFFIDVLRAQGANLSAVGDQSNLIEILPANPTATPWIMVKYWSIPLLSNIPVNPVNARALALGYTNFNNGNMNRQQVNGVWKYVWQDGANANVQQGANGVQNGIGGQNNPNPASLFFDHFVVQIDDTLYDPSYGVTYALGLASNPLVNFATAALAGYASPWRIGNQNFVVFQGPGDPANTSSWLVMRQFK